MDGGGCLVPGECTFAFAGLLKQDLLLINRSFSLTFYYFNLALRFHELILTVNSPYSASGF